MHMTTTQAAVVVAFRSVYEVWSKSCTSSRYHAPEIWVCIYLRVLVAIGPSLLISMNTFAANTAVPPFVVITVVVVVSSRRRPCLHVGNEPGEALSTP